MGGLGYALAGALAGAGKGIVQDWEQRREIALAKLRADSGGFTLGPGQVRYDSTGQVVAHGPDKPQEKGRIITPQPGGGAFRENPDGTVTQIITPNPGDKPFGAPVGGISPGVAPVRVKSIDDARRLPPGTRFIYPNVIQRTVPGGPTQPASGNFRS